MVLIGGILGFFILMTLMSLIIDLFKKVAGFLIVALIACGIAVGICQFAKTTKESVVEDVTESIQMDYEDNENVSLLTKGKEYFIDIIN